MRGTRGRIAHTRLRRALFHSGVLGASTCARPRSTEPAVRSLLRRLPGKKLHARQSFFPGTRGRIRTADPLFRRQML
jgi:hypothetical protein